MKFRGSVACTIEHQGSPDVYGEIGFSAPVPERCGVVRLRHERQDTTVRADSSATRGYADEFVSTNLILLQATTQARSGDRLTVAGVKIRIMSLFPRYDVHGVLDHFEVRGELWA